MKRLIKKAHGKTLYHGCTIDKLKAITQSGSLLPQEVGGAGLGDDWNADWEGTEKRTETNFEGFTFFATTEYVAMGYPEREIYDQYVQEYSDNRDETEAEFLRGDELLGILEVSLPESSLLPDDIDVPDAKTWKESADQIGQVKVLGEVTSDYFRKVHLYNKHTKQKIFSSNFSGWEDKFKDEMYDISVNKSNKRYKRDYDSNLDEVTTNYKRALENAGFVIQDNEMVNPNTQLMLQIFDQYWQNNNGKLEILLGFDGNIYIPITGVKKTSSQQGIRINKKYDDTIDLLIEKIDDPFNYFYDKFYKNNPGVVDNMIQVFGSTKIAFGYYIREKDTTLDELRTKMQELSQEQVTI